MGTFDAEGSYVNRQITERDISTSFADAIDDTFVDIKEGKLVTGTVVKIDRDGVLVDIGYKTEGVIPPRELHIKNDIDPNEVVKLGEKIETLVLTLEDKEEGFSCPRSVLSTKRLGRTSSAKRTMTNLLRESSLKLSRVDSLLTSVFVVSCQRH